MTIGDRIKQSRIKKDITQQQLADVAGVSKQAIYKYENGIVTNIPMDKLNAIAQRLNVSPSYLMGWDDEAPPAPAGLDESGYDLDAKEKALLSAFNELTEEGKNLSIEYTQMLGTQNKYKKFALQDAESVG